MEIALCCHEQIRLCDTCTYRRPRGSIIVAIPQHNIRRKWVEICGRLLSPENRDNFKNIIIYRQITGAWKKSWEDASIAMFRKEITADQAWDAIVSDNFPNLGTDPRGDVPLTDTWLWSDWERRNFYLGKVDREDQSLANKILYKHNEGIAIGPSHIVDYRRNPLLSQGDIAKIENVNEKIDPNFKRVWSGEWIVPTCDIGDIIQIDEPEG